MISIDMIKTFDIKLQKKNQRSLTCDIADYEIIKKVGQTDYFGDLYLAKHKSSETLVSLKEHKITSDFEGIYFLTASTLKMTKSIFKKLS
jgi:hypothetical protein